MCGHEYLPHAVYQYDSGNKTLKVRCRKLLLSYPWQSSACNTVMCSGTVRVNYSMYDTLRRYGVSLTREEFDQPGLARDA